MIFYKKKDFDSWKSIVFLCCCFLLFLVKLYGNNKKNLIDTLPIKGPIFSIDLEDIVLTVDSFPLSQVKEIFGKIILGDQRLIDGLTNSPTPIKALSYLGDYYFEYSKFEQSRKIFEQVLKQGIEERDWIDMANAHNHCSLMAEFEGRFLDMYEHNKQLVILGEKYDKKYIAVVHLNYGVFYDNLGDFEAAKKSFEKGLDVLEPTPEKVEFGWLLHRLGELHRTNGDLAEAKHYLLRAIDYWEKKGDKRARIFTLLQLGCFYSDSGDSEMARTTFQNALVESKVNNFMLSQINALTYTGKFENKQGNYKKAIKFLERGNNLSKENAIPYYFESIYDLLAQAYQEIGQLEKANFYYQAHSFEMGKNIKGGETATKELIRHMDNLAKKELAYQLLKETELQQQEKLKSQQLIIFFVLLSLLLIGWIAMNYSKSNKRNIQQKEELSMLNQKNQKQSYELKIANANIIEQKKDLELKLVKNLLVLSQQVERETALLEVLDKSVASKETMAMRKLIKGTENETLIEELDLQITKANQDFFEKISKQFTNLTKGDLRLCAFLKLNLRTKEIANLTFKKPESIKVARSRLRKKLGLTHSNLDLSAFLNQI